MEFSIMRDSVRGSFELSSQPTPFLGRSEELEAVVTWLREGRVRLLTLTGPAGVGKTRLALEVRDCLKDRFEDSAVLIDLAPVQIADAVVANIARVLGLSASGPQPLEEVLRTYLADKELLLILDNFEQVLPAASEVANLLAAAPRLRMLVTSRVPLRLRMEQTLRIDPLPVPELDAVLPTEKLLQIPSVALFVDRAQAVRSDFSPTDREAPLLVELIRYLDGLPLAIELASAQMRVLPLGIITRRLEQRVQTLQWDAQDLPVRHRSLQAAVGWSYELLNPEEQQLFRHLGVFVGLVSLNAIAAVLGEHDEDVVIAGLTALAEKSLVLPRPFEDIDPEPGFGMLETIREYAWEQLQREGELDAARQAHAQYFLELTERAAPELLGSEQRHWFLRLESEIDNLRLALRGLIDRKDGEGALRMVTALSWFWFARGYHSVARGWLEEVLATFPTAPPSLRARALNRLGLILNYLGDLDHAGTALQEAENLARESPDESDAAEARTYLGARDVLAGRGSEGTKSLQEQLLHWRARVDQRAAFHEGYSLSYLAAAAAAQGELEGAASYLSEAIEQHESSGDSRSAAIVRFRLAVVLADLEDRARAGQLVQEGLGMSVSLQDRLLLSVGVEAALIVLGDAADIMGRARLLGGADSLSRMAGLSFGILERSLGSGVAALREGLADDQVAAAYREGRFLSFVDLASLARDMLDAVAHTDPLQAVRARSAAVESPLSGREQDVLRLVAEGMTSKEIGQQLFLSHRTVDHHLTSIFNKLGVENRAQAVATAAQRGLL